VAGEHTRILDAFTESIQDKTDPRIVRGLERGPGIFKHLAARLGSDTEMATSYAEIPRAGHLTPQENPEGVAEVLMHAIQTAAEASEHNDS